MNPSPITIKPFGEQAVLIEWPERVDEQILNDILQFEAHLINNRLLGPNWETVVSYNSLTLINTKKTVAFSVIKSSLETWYSEKKDAVQKKRFLWTLPVCYDAAFGPDQDHVCSVLGMDVASLIQLHTQNSYLVYGIGFLPGFMYLGGLPQNLEIPRRDLPRLEVPKGAVGLAGKQTGIYPQQSPGGWQLIGNCPVSLFDSSQENPCFVSVGDKIKFEAISRAEYNLYRIEAEAGVYTVRKEVIHA